MIKYIFNKWKTYFSPQIYEFLNFKKIRFEFIEIIAIKYLNMPYVHDALLRCATVRRPNYSVKR